MKEHFRLKGKIESINGPLLTIRCFDYLPGEVWEEKDPITGEKKVKRGPFKEIDFCPTGNLIGRIVRIIA